MRDRILKPKTNLKLKKFAKGNLQTFRNTPRTHKSFSNVQVDKSLINAGLSTKQIINIENLNLELVPPQFEKSKSSKVSHLEKVM